MSVLAEMLSGVQGEMARVAQSTASALVAGLWQSALLVAGVGLVLKLVPRTTAAVRFAIWTAVFCVSVAMPFAGILFGRHTAAIAGPTESLRVDTEWSYLIAAIWVVASMARLVQLAVQGWKLRGLWLRAVPVAEEELLELGCGDLLAGRTVRVCTSEDIDRPSVIGFFAPKILIPSWLFEQLTATELKHIVLHEMEHLRRWDDWMNLLQKIGLVVFPLNPALFWVDRRLAAEREIACDDGVLRRTQMRRAYAMCLASIAEMRLERKMHRRVVALALGVLGAAGVLRGRSEFGRRIESILGRRPVMNRWVAGAVAAALVMGVLLAGVGLSHAPQLVSFAPVRGTESVAALSGVADRRVLNAGARLQEVSFHLPEAKDTMTLPMCSKSVPQRLKPGVETRAHGTAEDMPLSKTGFSVAGQAGSQIVVANMQRTQLNTAKAQTVQVDTATVHTSNWNMQWMVLTSFDEDAPSRVVVRLGDGRFYVAPYAAVPVRDGWLIVKL